MSESPSGPAALASDSALVAVFARLPHVFMLRWRLFVVTLVVVAVGVVAGIYIKRQKFESSALLLVKLDQRDVQLQSEVRYELARNEAVEAVNTQAELLQSPQNISSVVDRLGTGILEGPEPTSAIGRALRWVAKGAAQAFQDGLAAIGLAPALSLRDKVIEDVQKGLTIYPVRRAQLINVAFAARSPQAAHAVLEALIATHLARLQDLDASTEGYQFYVRQSTLLAQTLQQGETELAQFKAKHAVIDLATEKTLLIEKIERLTSSLEGAPGQGDTPRRAMADAGEPVAPGRAASPSAPEAGVVLARSDIPTLAAKLNELRIERVRRGTLYEANSPLVQEIDNQLQTGSRLLDGQVREVNRLIGTLKPRLALLARIEPELRQLQRNVVTQEENYRAYMQATVGRRIMLERENRVILQVVEVPSLPVRPQSNRLVLLGIGLVFALVAAIIAVVAAEMLAVRRAAVRLITINTIDTSAEGGSP